MRVFKRFILISLFFLSFTGVKSYSQPFNLDSLTAKIPDLADFFLYSYHDSNYIKNHSDKISLKLLANNKYNFFRLKDKQWQNSLYYRPQKGLRLGFGVAYKWFALDFVFRTGLKEDVDVKYDKLIDFQGRIFTSKHFVEATIQYYYGYKLGRMNGSIFESGDKDDFRNDIRTITFGLQYLYVVNFEKFSLQAPFVMNEIQRKSAGSLIAGFGYDMYTLNADSSMVPSYLQDEFNFTLQYTDLNTLNLSLKFGYMYSFVPWESYFLTLGLIPGINLNTGDYYIAERELINTHLALNMKIIAALGYNGKRVFTGAQLIGDGFDIKLNNNSKTLIGRGKLKIYFGYRFHGKRVKSVRGRIN